MTISSLPVSLINGGLALLRHPLRKRKTLPSCWPTSAVTSTQIDFMAPPDEIDATSAQHAGHLAALLCHPRQVKLAAFVDGQLVAAGGVAPASLRQNIAIGWYLVSLSSSAAGASAWAVSCAMRCCLPPAVGAIRSSSWKSMPATGAVWPCIKNLVFSLRYPTRDHLLPRYRRIRPPGGLSPAMRLHCHTALKKREQTDRPALSFKVNAQWQWQRE